MNLKYSIIIPTYNHCDDLLKPCIESIIKYTDLSDKEIIIVSNGCVDNTKEYIESLDKNIFKLLWFDEALGYTKATNEGIKNSNGEFIIFLNNDTIILNDNWIDMLINYWNSSNNVGIVGPSKLYFEDYPFILFYCAMTSKKIINEIGLLDETFNPGYGEDIDFSIRLIKNGYDIIVSNTNNDFPIYHIGEGTMHSDLMIDKWDKITNRNKNILKDRINNNYYDKKFKINIIVPTYNRYIELKIALNSILNQTKKEINVLVISDGHDETVLDIINEYDKKDDLINFKYYSIEYEGNLGSKPRIHGIENLDDNGYVCFLDDDNELYPEYIENMINNIIPEKYDISICQINVNNTYIMPLKKEYVSFENIDTLNFMVSNKIAKKCKDKWLQKKDEKVTHDFDFINECIKYSDFNFIPKVLANHNNYNYSKYLKEQDYYTYDEIFIKNMYNLKENEIKNKIVIDIGANKGYFSIYAILNGAKLVYAYEPDIINYNKLLENIKYYNIKNIIPINKAVYKDKNQYKMMQDDISDNYITVDSIDIDTIISQINDNNIHVKFDCEGSEYDIFLNSDNKIYNKIEMLYGEIHNGLHPNINYNSNLLKEHFENNYKEIIPEIIYTPGTYLENGDFIPLEIHHDMVKYQRKNKIYDCFMFFNELEILEIRLNELYDVVDYFVLVECNYTHQGNKKPLYYNENKNKFEKFNDKIIHIILDEFPDFEITEYFFWLPWQFLDLNLKINKNIDLDNLDDETKTKYTKNWKREDYQKFEIFKGLNNCNDDDIIIISDVDEIINSNIIKNYKDDNINKLILDHYLYDFNTKSPNKWDKPFICRYKNIKKYKKDNLIKDFSLLRNNDNLNFNKIKDAGWHFSYFGNINDIKLKLESFAHEELNIDINDEYIKENIKNFQKVNIDESYPKYVINNIDKYKKIGFIKEIDNMKDKMIKESPTLYNELFVMNINQVDPIEIKNKTIIDIGGHLGYFSILCSYFDPKEIYTFEPVEIFYDKLLDFVKDIKNIHTYNLAVLDKSIDYVSMDINGESSNIWGNGKKDTKCVSLEDIVNNYINKDDDLVLKLDCEGSEFNILYNTPNHILKRFSTMYIEFHDEMNPDYQYKTNDIIEKITNLGYDKFKGVQAGYYDENNNFTPSSISIWKFKRKNNENMKVTATISTRNRYFTTLPLCIHSIATQTYRPSELIIYDDNEDDKRIDLRNEPIYGTLFKLLEVNNIEWRVIFGKGEGQVKNHQLALKDSNYDFIWRLDDDNVPESNVLETLVKNINNKTGAIGGLVIDPNNITSNSNHSNLIEDIDMASNEQWNINSPKFDYKIVDHLYSSFLFRKEAGKHGYEMNLSRVGHREETIFTYEMKLQGWEIAINSKCITWHYHNPFGGIRDNTVKEMWDHDENIFRNKLKEWNIYNDNNFIDIVLDNGIGDHYAFKMILNELNEKNKKINLYCCFPEVFADDNVKLYSIHDALVKYNNNISQFNIYKWMDEMNWKGTLLEAFKKLYL